MMNELMKRVIGVLLFVVVAESAAVSETNYRTFTSKDGRSIEARITEHDAKKGRIKVERGVGKALWVPPSAFTESDQAYIKEWIAADRFLSSRWLSVSL